jgi:hypothetical protein
MPIAVMMARHSQPAWQIYLQANATKSWPIRAPDIVLEAKSPERGPLRGTTGYQTQERKLFPRISKLLKRGEARSPYGAALTLSKEISGRGTPESKAKRVSALYRKEKQ